MGIARCCLCAYIEVMSFPLEFYAAQVECFKDSNSPWLFRPLTALVAAFATVSKAAPYHPMSAITCPITLNGRVLQNTTLSFFDTTASSFNPGCTKGQNLTWSQILNFPSVSPSRFDIPGRKALEVTISDASIFVPGGGQQQLGSRRAGLLLGTGSDASNTAVQT